MKNKSILFIINDLDLGGAGKMMKYVINISSAWFKKVSLIEVYAKEASKEIPESVKTFPLGIEVKGILGFRYKIITSIRDIVKREKPDIVLTFVSDMCVNTRIATLGLNTIVCSADRGDPYTETFPWTILVPWAFNRSDYCFFQLDKARDCYSAKVQKKSFVIPNVFVANPGNTPYSGERKKTIVSAGRFVIEKGYDVLIKAFAKVHEKHLEYTMTIYGDGPFLGQYHKLAQELGVDDLITYPGYVKDVAASVREDGVFVLPSRYEGIPNSLIEALSVGIPCVATDCTPGGPMFLTKGGKNGLIVPIDDVDAMAEAILNVIDDDVLANTLSQNGPEILEELKPSFIDKQWMEAFNCIINNC
jgi:glycosyltransferase involved in cell wall biosynthesis